MPSQDPANFGEIELLERAAQYLRENLAEAVDVRLLVVAGSGLGGFVKSIQPTQRISYGDIPGIGKSTVVGHAGELILGVAPQSGIPILIMAGRRHIYEGLSAAEGVRLPRAVMLAFPGIKRLIVSNAAGGMNPLFEVGDLMLISDQINWMFRNPLIGPNRDEMGPRFPDMCHVYSPELRELARRIALNQGVTVRQGVYLAVHGPSYETRAEISMFRNLCGADTVGMSTVPEAIAAAHAGLQVLGISFISNMVVVPAVTTHAEVVENSRLVEEKFTRLVVGVLPEMHQLG